MQRDAAIHLREPEMGAILTSGVFGAARKYLKLLSELAVFNRGLEKPSHLVPERRLGIILSKPRNPFIFGLV